MKNHTARFFFANLLTYVLLTSQVAPMAFALSAAHGSAPPTAEAKGPEIASDESKATNANFAPVPVPLTVAPAAVLSNITASKVDSFADSDSDGKAEPGEIITYSITINNAGPDPALNVTLNDTVDANTTLIGASVHSTPIGFGDAFNVVGNVRIQVPDGASDLLANDIHPETGTNAGLTITTLAGDNSAPFAGTSANSGQVTATTGDGSFQYNPQPGFSGTDTFTYIVTNANGNSNAVTVTLTVTGTIWFVNSAAPAGGDGRITNPFNCLVGAGCFDTVAADDPGDTIFLYSGNYTGGLTLLANQELVGQGASAGLATLAGVTVPPFSDALPPTGGANPVVTTVAAATNAVNVSLGGITLRGFTIGNTTGAKIFGNNFGTLTAGDNTLPDMVLNGTGQALNLTNGTLAATSGFTSVATTSSTGAGILLSAVAGTAAFGSTTVSGSTAEGIVVGTTTANINFGNTSVSGGTAGVSLQNNSSGTRTFGTLSISNNTGIGFASGAGGGNATITGTTNIPAAAQTAPVGTAIDIQSLAAGTAVTFAATSINKGNAGTGVNLGSGATGNAGNVTFNSLAITTSNGSGLVGAGNTGQINVTTNAGSIASTNGPAINISKAAAPATPITLNFTNVSSTNSGTNGINLDRVSGNMTVGATTVTNSTGTGIQVQNTSAAGTMNFGNTGVTGSGNANVDANGMGIFLNANAGNVTFADLDITPDNLERAFQSTASTGTITTTSGDIAATGNVTLDIVGPAGRTPLAIVLNNVDSTNSNGIGVNLNLVSGNFTVNSATATNVINSAGVGIQVQNTAAGTMNFGNTVANDSAGTGVFLNANAGAITFADLDIDPDNNVRAFHATSNTGIITTTSGTLVTTGTGIGVEVTGGTTPLNMTLTSVSTNGAESGIVLGTTTANPAGFVVNGDGTLARNGSGGTITNTTNDGVRLTGANTVTLRSMNLTNNGNTIDPDIADNESTVGEHAVEANGGANITLSGVLIQNPAASGMIALNLTGTNRLNNNSLVTDIDRPATHGLFIRNNSGFNLTLFEVNDTDFTSSASTLATLNVMLSGTAIMTVEVENGCIFEGLTSQAVLMDAGVTAGTTGTLTSSVVNSTFQNSVGLAENNVAAAVTNGALHNATISGNTFTNIAKDGTLANTSIIRTQNTGGRLNATVLNNLVQNIAYAAGQGGRHVIGHIFEPSAALFNAANFSNLRIEGNTASNITYTATNREFIFIDYRDFASGGDIKILGNNWNMPTAAATSEAVDLRFRQANASTVRVQVDNNGRGTGAISNTGTRFFRVDVEDAANVQLTVTNNTFTNNNAAPGRTFEVNTEDPGTPGGPPTACVNVSGNILTAAAPTTILLNEAAGALNVTQTSAANVTAVNNGATVAVGGTPQFAQPACALPTNLTFEEKGSESPITEPEPAAAQAPAQATAAPQIVAPTDSITARPFVSSPRQETTKDATATTKLEKLVASDAGAQTREINKSNPQKKTKVDQPVPNPPVVVGNNLTWNVGTLPVGQSVTITFQVQVENPYNGPANVSNQGTVTGDGGISVLTDDPAVGGGADPTLTPIDAPPDINIKDAKVGEPPSGQTSMLFAVTLSAPATGPVSANFATANGGPTPATGGATCDGVADYLTTNGTVNFIAGQQIQTIAIPVCADATVEGDETFLVDLSTPTNGIIVDGQATGTITPNVPGVTLISELRTSGPSGTNDDFVEIYNNTDSPVDVSGYGLFKMGAACGDTPVLIGTIQNSTVIPARGHYLFVGSTYSLANYGGAGAATGNLTMSADIENDRNVALFTTNNVLNISSATRLDAVGFGANTGNNCDLLREGTNLQAASGSTSEYSFVRKLASGTPQDTNDNSADLVVVSTTPLTPVGANVAPGLGAPGPENLASPLNRNATIKASLIDPAVASTAVPNRERLATPVTNGATGTLDIRRKFTNNTGQMVTRLRFRIVDVTTFPVPAGTADLRGLTSGQIMVTTSGGPVTVQGTTVEVAPPTQASGGGLNSTMTVSTGVPIAPGATINVRFLLGVQQTGGFRFFINVEALP